MKPFYGKTVVSASPGGATALMSRDHEPQASPEAGSVPGLGLARIAVYDSPAAAPRVEDVSSASAGQYIESLASRIYDLAREQGGEVPYTVIREVTENFIHADFREPVVSIMDRGATIRFADQGPGISDKERAMQPGYTSATSEMKHYIRGVGSGLPIVREYLMYSGGTLRIDDNLGGGAVITITTRPSISVPQALASSFEPPSAAGTLPLDAGSVASPMLSTRQKQVLALIMEAGSAGPSLISRELGVGLSTAYRDLAHLEEVGLIHADEAGKRSLTEQGASLLDDLIRS